MKPVKNHKIVKKQTKNTPISNGVKLNLGCGKKYKKGYINIDIQKPCDLKLDLRNPWPFDDNCVDEIFADGLIWLFSRKEWWGVKREIARVLKDGGKLEIIFLDFEYILKAFIENKDGERWGWWWKTIFSAQRNDYDFSKNGFTYDKLVSDLQEEGFTNFSIQRTPLRKKGYVHLICYKRKPSKKVLIGTPIHQIKDYAMEKWLKNVAKLQKNSPADLLLVDNSPGLDYIEKVKGYLKKHKVKNYMIEHLEMHQEDRDERIGRSREIVRQYILSKGYDAWFSWESDQIIPEDTLVKLARIMEAGNYTMIHPNAWSREVPSEPDASFGVCLISREALEKYGFLLEYPDMHNCWHGGEAWFKSQVIKGGGSYIEIYGLIKPILHLNDTIQ